jgi:thioredoxin-dependent peroxiredoxin
MELIMRVIPAITAALLVSATPLVAQSAEPRGEPTARAVSGPEPGEMAPEFALPWATADSVGPASEPFHLAHRRGKVVVLAFYPRDFTTGCTAEMRTFGEQFDTMFGDGVEVVGISIDSLETHVRFASSLKLPFKLLSDPTQAIAKRYGSHGNQGSMRRTVYVIDREGRVHYRNLMFRALDRQDYEELKTAVREARDG